MSDPEEALSLEVAHSIRKVPEAEWTALAGPDCSPFVEWDWLDALEESGCVGSTTAKAATDHAAAWYACHLLVRRGERLIAAAPAYLKGNSEGEFVFDWSWADLAQRRRTPYYPKLVIAVPFTPATGERVLVASGEDRDEVTRAVAVAAAKVSEALEAHSAHVLFPNEQQVATFEQAGYARRVSVQYHWENRGYTTWDDFLSTFDSKRRHQIRREWREGEKQGVLIETVDPSTLTPQLVDAMFDFYASTVDKFAWGRRYLNRAFFELVASRFKRNLAWVVAREGTRPIAGAFNVEKAGRLYGRYWGAREERPFLHFNVCYYHGVRHAIARGLGAFEPGAGGEHKRPRGFEPTLTHSAHLLHDPKMNQIVSAFVDREREHIAAQLAGTSDEG